MDYRIEADANSLKHSVVMAIKMCKTSKWFAFDVVRRQEDKHTIQK